MLPELWVLKTWSESCSGSLAPVFHCGLAAWSPGFCYEDCRLGSAAPSHSPDCAHAGAAECGSVGQCCVCVCGCVFVWGSVLFWSITPLRIWYPAGCRGWMIAQLAELLMGAFFFLYWAAWIGSRRKKLNCSTCIYKEMRINWLNLIYILYVYIYVMPCCCDIHFTACCPQILPGAYTFHMKPCSIADILTENNTPGHPRLQQWSTGKPTLTAANPSCQLGNPSVY